jgi:hypothetical protein
VQWSYRIKVVHEGALQGLTGICIKTRMVILKKLHALDLTLQDARDTSRTRQVFGKTRGRDESWKSFVLEIA